MEHSGRKTNTGRNIALGINLALILLAGWVFFNRQEVFDRISLFGYTPTAEAAALADQTKMTDISRRYFYASRPEVNDRAAFKQNCSNDNEKTIVLGCYAARRIYLFNVTDERLPGVKAVTAAHEVLHAAYERLDATKKSQVDKMVQTQMKTINDARISQLIDTYNETEPGQLLNEMHSILATEVATLNPELEGYYRQYFADRGSIVNMSANYEKVFSNLRTRQNALVDELNKTVADINDRSSQLNQEVERLNADVSSFNRRAQDNQYTTQAEFDRERNALVARQQQLQAERDAIESLIKDYENKKKELDAINLEAESLNTSINSNLDSIPSVR